MTATTEPQPTGAGEPVPDNGRSDKRGFVQRVRGTLGRVPRAGWLCSLVAFITVAAWGLLTPPFHVPDENSHTAYVQLLAETGELPKGTGAFSPEQEGVMSAMRFYEVVGAAGNRPPQTPAAEQRLRDFEAGDPSPVGSGGASTASNNPPLFYAAQSVVYLASPWTDLLDRMVLMRLFSALIAAAAVLVVFLFLRELLPSTPWAWTVGALGMAFQPVFDQVSSGVSPDGALVLCTALLLLGMARAFRHGLTVRRGVLIGGALAAGILVKTTMFAFAPAAGLAVAGLWWRDRRSGGWRGALSAAGALAAPLAAFAALNAVVFQRPLVGAAEAVAGSGTKVQFSTTEHFVYLWQLFLPRLGFMKDEFAGGDPLDQLWFKGWIGRFGWLDYDFPPYVYDVALAVVLVLLALAISALFARRHILRERWFEFACYAIAVLGLFTVIGIAGYRQRLLSGGQFEQARYLLPLIPLYAVLLGLASRGLGRRWGPALGAAIVVLAFAHTLFGQLVTIQRYYG